MNLPGHSEVKKSADRNILRPTRSNSGLITRRCKSSFKIPSGVSAGLTKS